MPERELESERARRITELEKLIVDAPHAVGCATFRAFHKEDMTHYETDGNEPCPFYHYESGKCDCWKSRLGSQ